MSAGLVELFGDKLQSAVGEIPTMEALAGKKAVAIYFSAHWCPPCKGFTPMFAKWYTDNLKTKGLEVVFASSDHDEGAFKEYFGEMPWLAIPFRDRDRKEALSKKFKVQGIPSVVVLDGDGKTVTKDGRAAISQDPEGLDMPWKPKSLQDIMADAKFFGKDGPVANHSLKDKVLGLYFSAHWCPPCRGFTPQLAEWYTKNLKGRGLDIIFVSSDKDQSQFDEYFKEMPWLALDYSERKTKEQLSQLFGVSGIPSFVILDKDGTTITKEGRAAVSSDPEGTEFPWYPALVHNLKYGPGSINEAPNVVAFVESLDKAVKQAAEAAMTPIARQFLEAAKTKEEEEDPEIGFMISTDAGGLGTKVRELLSLPSAEETARLFLIDVPDNGAYYVGPVGEITSESVATFVKDFQDGKLERKQLGQLI